MTTQMSDEMSTLFNMMKIEFEKQTNIITQSVTKTIMQSMDEKLMPLVEENKNLKLEIESLNKKISYLENANKKNNLIIHGIKETENNYEGLLETVKELFNTLEVQIEKNDINRINRIGKKNLTKTRPIIISLTTFNKKIEILKNKKKMPKNTYMTEDLTKEALQKHKELKNQLKQERERGNEAYIRNGQIIVKQKENERRKRDISTSPGTSAQHGSEKPTPAKKMHKTDLFAYMRPRSHSMTEKNINKV